MDPGAFNSSSLVSGKVTDAEPSEATTSEHGNSTSKITTEAPPPAVPSEPKNLKGPEITSEAPPPVIPSQPKNLKGPEITAEGPPPVVPSQPKNLKGPEITAEAPPPVVPSQLKNLKGPEITAEAPSPVVPSQPKNLKGPESVVHVESNSQIENPAIAAFSRLTSGFGMPFAQKVLSTNENGGSNNPAGQSGVFESITKGIVDSSLGAVKAVQVKARHIVSQNKRRYQEGGFDLDMTYITENIIAMGFPAGDLSSGLFGFIEGLYRNHMEEVIKFFETHHKGKYKVYNLCSERLYDASLFEGKVATFPFDDHNCPPLQLVELFCQSAHSWLKEDILNVVVVHCKAGKARTGLMICCLLLYLKFFPTSVECIDYYNQKRCVDGKGLILPSQIRYVKYFERIQTQFNGETPPGRRCMLRGFRLHKCQYWVRPSITILNHNGVLFTTKKHPKTKDLMPEDFWIRSQRKGIVVFALPGEPGLTELTGDFKIHFHDRHGDFYCWLNTAMMENRVVLDASEFDDFDKRSLPTPGFDVEIVMVDYNGEIQLKSQTGDAKRPGVDSSDGNKTNSGENKVSKSRNNDDDVFSDSEGEETTSASNTMGQTPSAVGAHAPINKADDLTVQAGQLSLQNKEPAHGTPDTSGPDKSTEIPNLGSGDIKAIAADASVFTFGDDEDYESD